LVPHVWDNEPPVWDLWTTSKNTAMFRCNTANSSKNRNFSILQNFSLQHNLCNVAICNERMQVTKWSGLRCNLTTEIRIRLSPWVGCHKLQPFLSLKHLQILRRYRDAGIYGDTGTPEKRQGRGGNKRVEGNGSLWKTDKPLPIMLGFA